MHELTDEYLYTAMQEAGDKLTENELAGLLSGDEPEHQFSPEFERRMSKLMKQQRRTPFMRGFIKYSQRVAVVFLIFITAAFATTMSVEALREKFFTMFVSEENEIYKEYRYEGPHGEGEETTLIPIVPEYLPKDYSESERTQDTHMLMIDYTKEIKGDDEPATIGYGQFIMSGTGVIAIDNEDIKKEEFEIEGITVKSNYKYAYDSYYIYWFDDRYSYSFYANKLEQAELLKMAESIIKQSQK